VDKVCAGMFECRCP